MAGSGQRASAGWTEKARKRIRAAQYLTMLEEFIKGQREMTDTQVRTALSLLDRVLPKLSAQTVRVEANPTPMPRDMALSELLAQWSAIKGESDEQTLQ